MIGYVLLFQKKSCLKIEHGATFLVLHAADDKKLQATSFGVTCLSTRHNRLHATKLSHVDWPIQLIAKNISVALMLESRVSIQVQKFRLRRLQFHFLFYGIATKYVAKLE